MAIFVDTGRGYVSAEHNKDAQGLIGYIPVDSIFTPVTKVNYTVESTRVEQRKSPRTAPFRQKKSFLSPRKSSTTI